MRRFNGIYLLVLLIFSNSVFSGIGINGGPCQYSSLTAAIAAANAGDTLYINPGNYISYIGDIDKDLTLVPGAPAAPDNSGCETELLTADSSAVVINGNGASHDIHGGLGKISNAAQVVFRHLTLDNATAENGGLLAVIEGASLTLDGVRAMNGNATANGGLIWVNSSIAQPSELRLINNSQLYYGEAVGHGGVIAMDNSELYVSSSSLGGTAGNASSVAGQLGGILYLLNSEAGIYGSSTQLNWGNAGVDGGAIYADYSNVTFNNGEIRNNTANNNGGGVAQRQGFFETRYAEIRGNTANGAADDSGGGGLFVTGDAAISIIHGTDVLFNLANKNGGGLWGVDGSQITISNEAEISGNVAFADGAGVASSAMLTLNDAKLLNNTSPFGVGGGVACLLCSELVVESGTDISGNEANQGGGIYLAKGSSEPTTINASIISDNLASDTTVGFGGGVFLAAGQLVLNSTQLNNNSAIANGGGLYAKRGDEFQTIRDIELNNVVFNGNTTTTYIPNQGGGGAYIYSIDNLIVQDVLFNQNVSNNIGGALYVNYIDQISIDNSVFSLNSGGSGAAVYNANSTASINNSTFQNNVSTSHGGAWNQFGSELLISNSTFSENAANYGGALRLSHLDVVVLNSQYIGNHADNLGGAMYLWNSSAEIRSEYGTDGAACDPSQLGFNSYCTQFIDNTAGEYGGAVYTYNNSTPDTESLAFLGGYWTGNDAVLAGSALYFFGEGVTQFQVQNGLMHHNGSAVNESSVIEVDIDGLLDLSSLTLVENQGPPLNVVSLGTDLNLINSIFYDNSLGPYVDFAVAFTRACNNIQNPQTTSQSMGGNLGDPIFVTDGRGPYRLAANSPSLDACSSGPSTDLDGLFRPGSNAMYDQGAFEMDGIGLEDIIFASGFQN